MPLIQSLGHITSNDQATYLTGTPSSRPVDSKLLTLEIKLLLCTFCYAFVSSFFALTSTRKNSIATKHVSFRSNKSLLVGETEVKLV